MGKSRQTGNLVSENNIFVNISNDRTGIGTTNPRYTLEVGAVGASGTSLWVNGNARVTGILSVGQGTVTIDGTNNQINIGTGVTIYGNTGIISATKFYGDGSALVGVSTFSGGLSASEGADLGRLRVTGISTLGQTNTAGLSNAGVSTLGNFTATTAVVSGFSTLSGGVSATLLTVSGVSTFSGGINGSEGADLGRLRVTGIATLGQTNTTGLSNAGVSTLGNFTATTAVVSGFSTLSGGVSATLLTVSGVSTFSGGINGSEGADLGRLRVTGIATLGQTNTTGLSNAGVSTLGNFTATTAVVSGFSTLGSISAANLTLAGVTTGLNAPGISTLGFVQHTTLNVSGVSTFSGGLNASEGADLSRLRVTGITTLGQTNTTGLSNAGVSTLGNATATTAVVSGFSTLGSISGANLILAGLTTGLNVPGISTLGFVQHTTLNVSGVSTFSGGLNASEGADLGRLRVTGISTLGQSNTTGFSNAGVSTLGNSAASTLVVSGFSTLGSVSGGNLSLAGVTTGLNVPGISTFGDVVVSDIFLAGITTGLNASGISTLTSVTGTSANFTGISTLGSISATTLRVTGVSTVGVVTGATSIQASYFYGNGSQLTGISAGGGSITVQDEGSNVGTAATTFNFVGSSVAATYSNGVATITVSGGGGGSSSRSVAITTTSSLTSNSDGTVNITCFKTYSLLSVQTSAAAWVRIYSSSSAQSNDSSRSIYVDPTPGSGVVAEAITSGIQTVFYTPSVVCSSTEATASTTVPLRVRNLSGITTQITVTLNILQMEA